MAPLRIGEVARLANVNVQTLRFYEREGLLPAPQRRPSGFRAYSPDVVLLVRFIQRAKKLGFSLREVKELLALYGIPKATPGDVLAIAQRKLSQISGKLSDLRAVHAALAKLVKRCPGGKVPISKCPIIVALAGEAQPSGKSRRPTGEV
jgi:MerR family copper efflux transcriptional regulator